MALRDKDRTRLNYAGAIAASALVHVVFIYLVLFALPRWLHSEQAPPPAYTVAIVDNLPAGDLGTHLPRLSGKPHRKSPRTHRPPEQKPSEKQPPAKAAAAAEAPNSDINALALNNTTATAVATPEATPTPTPSPVETPEPTMAPTEAPTPMPTRAPRPKPTSRPQARRHNRPLKPPEPRVKPKIMLAKVAPLPKPMHTPSVKERLAMLRKQMMEEHLKELAQAAKAKQQAEGNGDNDNEEESASEPTPPSPGESSAGGGPVASNSVSSGRGYGVGSGTGSVGILKDPEFLLYYQKVQERIKDAWSFAGGSKELTTTVNFAIAPDGRLTGLELAHSSNNTSFDQSVLRAIRRAAPFPPPPERYREQFAQGVQAVFELGELSS